MGLGRARAGGLLVLSAKNRLDKAWLCGNFKKSHNVNVCSHGQVDLLPDMYSKQNNRFMLINL